MNPFLMSLFQQKLRIFTKPKGKLNTFSFSSIMTKQLACMTWLHLIYRYVKGLLNYIRERIKHVNGINLLGTALNQTSKNKITPHTSK